MSEEGTAETDVDLEHIHSRLGTALATVPELRPAPAAHSEDALGLQIWFSEHRQTGALSLEAPERRSRELLLVAELEVPGTLRRAVGETRMTARVLLERERPDASPLEDDVAMAAKRAFEVLGARIALARGDDGIVDRLLAADDPELLLLALEWIRDRRPEVHSDVIVTLLGHPDPRVARLAVESLGVVGSVRDAREIVKRVQLGDPDHTREVYRALGALGGQEAVAFLQFAAGNEDDPGLRREAEQAYLVARRSVTGGRAARSEHAGLGYRQTGFARGHRQ